MTALPRRRLTLIELLIAVVVIGVLAGIAVPKFNGSRRKAYIAELNVRSSAGVSVEIQTGPG